MQTTFTRADLPHLKTLSAHQIYTQALRSFDQRGMSPDTFAQHLLSILDPSKHTPSPNPLDALYKTTLASLPQPKIPNPITPAQLKEANEALTHKFTFYQEAHQLPESIDWDFNPGTAHWGHDLNRFTYLSPLTAAYHSTQDKRYARKAIDLILDWIAKADFSQMFTGSRYVFGSYLNNALHISIWARTVQSLLPHNILTPLELATIVKSLHDQCVYLQIVTAGHAGNWPTIGMRGMLPVIAAFPFRDSNLLADYAVQLLHDQIADQVLPDGVQDELTSHYHSVVLANLFECIPGLTALGKSLTPQTLHTFGKMLRYWQAAVTPGAKTQIANNDSDPIVVDKHWDTAKSLGFAHLLDDPALIGPRLYEYAGVAFLRQTARDGDLYLAFDIGPFGRSHQHEDKLSFMLHAHGKDILVDPGRHLYDNSAVSFRAHLKHTRAHSTILIDDLGQNSAAHRPTWISRTPCPVTWSTSPTLTRAGGFYDLGYGPQPQSPNDQPQVHAIHHREILFVDQTFWLILDCVEAHPDHPDQKQHTIDLRFQYGPTSNPIITPLLPQSPAQPSAQTPVQVITTDPDANLLLLSLPSIPFESTQIRRGQKSPDEGWYSPVYGSIQPAPNLSLKARSTFPFHCLTLLWPSKGPAPTEVALSVSPNTSPTGFPALITVRKGSKTWHFDANHP